MDARYVVDEIIPMFDDGYGPDGYVVLDMHREEAVASFLNTCPDARRHAQALCDTLNADPTQRESLSWSSHAGVAPKPASTS